MRGAPSRTQFVEAEARTQRNKGGPAAAAAVQRPAPRADSARSSPPRGSGEDRGKTRPGVPPTASSSGSVPSLTPVGAEASRGRTSRAVGASASPPRDAALEHGPLRRQTAAEQMKKASVRTLSELPAIGIYHSPGVGDVLCALLQLTKHHLLLTCYCFDLPEGGSVLANISGRGVKVRLLLCKGQMKNPSCTNQYETIVKLFGVSGAQHLLVRAN